MRFNKSILIGAALLAATTIVADAQTYPYYPFTPANPAAAAPPAWSYDPYTSGMAPCPQGHAGDLQSCGEKLPPTYGQPNFRPPQR